jgi:hypothetical protein
MFFLGNKKNCGIEFPRALTATAVVTRELLSEDITAPACFTPFLAKVVIGLSTGTIAFSSTL